MLKFGHTIDLEKLERMGVNKVADEIREKIVKEDLKREKEVFEWDRGINVIKDELTRLTKENTTRLEKVVELTEMKKGYESTLNAGQANVVCF